MSERPTAPNSSADPSDMSHLRSQLAAADRRLLGDTISLSDDDWRAPTELPGWTRAHVATHIARQGEALLRLAGGALNGTPAEMYPGDRDAEIEAGALRTGVEIQTDLDTIAGQLAEPLDQLDELDGWDRPVRFRDGSQGPARLLPSARLTEVVVHHVDLDLGFTVADIDDETAISCLRWTAFRMSNRPDFPSLRLLTEAGARIDFGDPDDHPTTISGPANLLLGLLTGRSGADGLTGVPDRLPSFG